MKEMNNVYELPCVVYSLDWSFTENQFIDLNYWIFFTCELRCGVWFIIGHRVDDSGKWVQRDLSRSGVINDKEIARFISYANHYPASKGDYQGCKVSRFNSLHYDGSFNERLMKLLKEVEDVDEKTDYPEMPGLWE